MGWRNVSLAVVATFLASCTTNSETTYNMTSPSYAPGAVGELEQAEARASVALAPPVDKSLMSPAGDSELPSKIAYLPASNPVAKFPPIQQPPAKNADAEPNDAKSVPGKDDSTAVSEPAKAQTKAAPAPKSDFYVTATDPQASPAEPRKSRFLSSFFGAPATPAKTQQPTPVIEMPSNAPARPVIKASLGGAKASEGNFLPGVRQEGLFEIKRKSGLDDDSDIDLHEDEGGGSVRIASAAGYARLSRNGLLTQTESVDVSCLKPSLVRMLKTVEQHYGKKLIVTSGYRDPAHNRRARGAKNSQHMYCAAADVQVPGVTKWELARFVRALPGRGGVGTYCHTESIHIDVGPERDWNWRCRRQS